MSNKPDFEAIKFEPDRIIIPKGEYVFKQDVILRNIGAEKACAEIVAKLREHATEARRQADMAKEHGNPGRAQVLYEEAAAFDGCADFIEAGCPS